MASIVLRTRVEWTPVAAIGVFAILALGALGASAQTVPAPQDCAVSTARIGSVDVTEFFGIRGGAAAFDDVFGASVAQRCIRLEIENPSPADMLPVGGYVMSGFAFDPTASP